MPRARTGRGEPAPQPLTRVQGLINTIDLESGVDRLADAADAAPWLEANGIVPTGRMPSADELATIRDFREALRAMVFHNTGGSAPTAAQLAPVSRIADAAATRARVDGDGTVRIAPVG